MDKDNPACYECPKSQNKLHTWQRHKTTTGELLGANCINCDLFLTKEQADDVWRET